MGTTALRVSSISVPCAERSRSARKLTETLDLEFFIPAGMSLLINRRA